MKGKAGHFSGAGCMFASGEQGHCLGTHEGTLEASSFADLLYSCPAVAQSMGCLRSPLEMCTLQMYWICPWTPMSLLTASATRSPMGR